MSATTRQAQRAAFFWRGVSAFRNATGKTTDLYRCPICFRRFTVRALHEHRLTDEHVPPQSRGGTVLTLTCASCNETAGYGVDAEVHQRERLRQFNRTLAGLEQGPVSEMSRVEMAGTSITAEATIEGGTVTLNGMPEHSPPEATKRQSERLEEMAESGSTDLKLQVTLLIRVDFGKSKVGDLRSAYLLAFAALGYRYIFQSELEKVRRQIRNPDENVISGYWQFLGHEGDKQARQLVGLGEPFHGLAVRIGTDLILLPPVGSDGNFYESLTDYGPGKLRFHGRQLEWPTTFRLGLDFETGSAVTGRSRYAPADTFRWRMRWNQPDDRSRT